MILNCAIIDDEPLAISLLKSYVNKTSFLCLKGEYNNAIVAIKHLLEDPVDILFLDIQMPELNGIEFARILPKETKIIFTTAFNQYAIDSYKVSAIDYLLKPISFDDFVTAANKALQWFNAIRKQQIQQHDRQIFVKSEYKLIKIDLDNILYIEGLKDYIRLYLTNGDKIMSLMNMKMLEDYLPKPEFLRIHRSYIAHMTKIQSVDRFRIVYGNTYLPVSDSYKEEVQAYLDNHTLL